jgi:hypothetical protein
MGKRSDFERIPRDNYTTPAAAVAPLLRQLAPRTRFIEPCAGAGKLVEHLTGAGHVLVTAHDLPVDARTVRYDIPAGAVIVTNPPWSRPVLHEILVNLSDQAPAWLLIDADWVHTRQAIPYLSRLRMIVSVGRVRWIPGSPYDGKDNCCWHLFERPSVWATTRFIGRMPRELEEPLLLEAAE